MKAHDVFSAEGFDLSSAVIVDVQPVADYVEAQPDGTTWTLADLPNVAPPWPHAIYEWRVSGSFMAVEIISEFDSDSHAFECLARSFVGTRDDMRHVCDSVYYPDSEGRADTWYVLGSSTVVSGSAHEMLVAVAALAVSFCHCVNVSARQVVPAPEQQKQRARRRKPPALTYRVLDITPATRHLEASGGETLARRLHICRGHFKTYGPEGPLFGTHTGTYWWQDSIRGSTTKGVAFKDYRVPVHARRVAKAAQS